MDLIYTWILVVAAYLVGSIPTSYLLAHLVGGIDLRKYGSGNLGIANFSRQFGRKWSALIVLFDVILKGCVPIVLASEKVFDLGIEVQILLGISTVIGHNWSIFLRFAGGRGMGPAIGIIGAFSIVLIATYMLVAYFVWLLMKITIKRPDSAIAWGVSVLLLPVYIQVIGLPDDLLLFSLAFLLLTITKRLLTNKPKSLFKEKGIRPFLLLLCVRLLLDRDSVNKEEWITQLPIDARD